MKTWASIENFKGRVVIDNSFRIYIFQCEKIAELVVSGKAEVFPGTPFFEENRKFKYLNTNE